MKIWLWNLGAFSALLMGIQIPCQSALAQEQKPSGFKLDMVVNAQMLPQSEDGLCPSGSKTIYISGARNCAKCDTDYVAVESEGKITCIRERLNPMMRAPDGYQPDFQAVDSQGNCPYPLTLITLHGRKSCIQCEPGYRYHPYYGQGRCLTCDRGESLQEVDDKIMCLKCPGNSRMVGTYPASTSYCVCSYPAVFAWGDMGYGCYLPPGH